MSPPRTGRVFRRFTTPLYMVVAALLLILHAPRNYVFTLFDDLALGALSRWEASWRPPPPASTRVVVVAIDDASMRDHDESWPWSRRTIARLLDRLREGGARAVGVDLFFANANQEDPGGDALLAAAIGAQSVVLASAAEPGSGGLIGLRQPYLPFREAAYAVGAPVLLVDPTGQVNRVSLHSNGRPKNLKGFALETLMAGHENREELRISYAPRKDLLQIYRGAREQPEFSFELGERASMRVNHRYLEAPPRISALALLRGEVPASALEGRIALVGLTASSHPDRYDTPVRQGVGGVEIHAAAMDSILRGDWLHQLSVVTHFLLLIMLGTVLASCGAVLRPRPLIGVAALALGGWWAVALFAYIQANLVIPLAAPTLLTALLTVGGLLRYRFRTLVEVTAEDVHQFSAVHDLGGGSRGSRGSQTPTQVLGEAPGTEEATPITAEVTRRGAEAAPGPGTTPGTAPDTIPDGATRTRDATRDRELPQERVGRLLDRGDAAAAATVLREVDMIGTPAGVLYELGRRFEDRAELESAQELYRAVIAREPEFREVESRLERVSERLRHFDEDDVARMIVRSVLHPRYKKPSLVGKGGMGFVFQVEDAERDGEELALKVLSPFLANEQVINERFRREAEMLAGLEHPNLIRIVDVYPTNIPYYTMEFLEAPSLHDLLAEEGPLASSRVLAIARSAANGLAKAHELGIFHRDLKPDNLIIEAGDQAKVIDFGIAHFEGADALTQAGQILGTLRYMSPEQLAGRPVDARSDVYSLGLVVHHMLRGALPFVLGKSGLPEAPPDLGPLRRSHPDWAKLLESWLSQVPSMRPRDGAALV